MPGGFAQTPIVLDRTTGRYRAGAAPVRVQDVLVDTGVSVAGRRIAADDRKGLVLLRVDGPLRAAYVTAGIYGDAWAGRTSSYRRFDCTGGSLTVTLQSDDKLFDRVQVVRAFAGGRAVGVARVAPGKLATLRVPLVREAAGSCTVRFETAYTRVPARVQPGAADRRALGIRILGFEVSDR